MANYRFKTAEIEAMKQNILTHIEHETETKTAWRLRCAIEGQLMCCRPSIREAARLERELALYEQLTTNDLPQLAERTNTARHAHRSTPNFNENHRDGKCSGEGENAAETQENTPKRKIQYFHYTSEQLKRYIIDVYEKRANREWVLLPYEQIDTDKCFWDVINGKIGEWDRRQEKFIEVNMDFNSPTCWRCFKINRAYQKDNSSYLTKSCWSSRLTAITTTSKNRYMARENTDGVIPSWTHAEILPSMISPTLSEVLCSVSTSGGRRTPQSFGSRPKLRRR